MASNAGIRVSVKYGGAEEKFLVPKSTSWDMHGADSLLRSLRLAFGIPAEVDLQLREDTDGEKGAILDLTGILWAQEGGKYLLEEVTPVRAVFNVDVQQKTHKTCPDMLAPVQVRYFTVYGRHFVEIAVQATASCSKRKPLLLLRVAVAPNKAVQYQQGGDASNLISKFGLVSAKPQFQQRSTDEMKGKSFGGSVSASATAGVTAAAGMPTAAAGVSAGGGFSMSRTSSKSRTHHDFEVLLGINSRTRFTEKELVPKWSLVLTKHGKEAMAKVLDNAPPKTRMSVSEEFVSVWEITPAMKGTEKVSLSFNVECQAMCDLPKRKKLKRGPWAEPKVGENLSKLYFRVNFTLTKHRIRAAAADGAPAGGAEAEFYPCWRMGLPAVKSLPFSDSLESYGQGSTPKPQPSFLQNFTKEMLYTALEEYLGKYEDLGEKERDDLIAQVKVDVEKEGAFQQWKEKATTPSKAIDRKFFADVFVKHNIAAPAMDEKDIENDVGETMAQRAKTVTNMTVEELFQHLVVRKDMAVCAQACREHGVDGNILLTLDESDMKEEMGLRLGDRRRLVAFIDKLEDEEDNDYE